MKPEPTPPDLHTFSAALADGLTVTTTLDFNMLRRARQRRCQDAIVGFEWSRLPTVAELPAYRAWMREVYRTACRATGATIAVLMLDGRCEVIKPDGDDKRPPG